MSDIDGRPATRPRTLPRNGAPELRGSAHLPRRPPVDSEAYPGNGVAQLGLVLAGGSSDPVFAGPLLYFHSFRKVQEGSQSVSTLTDPESWARRSRANGESAVSAFKQELLRAMMSKAGLFERFEGGDSVNILETLNRLVERYAGGTVEKLLPQPDETFDFRVKPSNGGPSFSFDGLSSGQKEVISTLFLIWFHTRTQSSIVLIDEPELHLNPEWQRTFVRDLWGIAPRNQYLLATHSEEVFASVEASRRIVLTASGGAT